MLLVFGVQVDLPEVDEDPEGAWAEMVRAEHAREMAYKAEHWEADPDNPGAVREREDAWLPEGYAREDVLALIRRQEASVETEPAPVCKASREVEASGWVICDGQGHDREHHSGRLTTGPSVGNRYAWPFGPSDRAKLAEDYQIVVNVEHAHPLDVGHQLLQVLREHARVTARGA